MEIEARNPRLRVLLGVLAVAVAAAAIWATAALAGGGSSGSSDSRTNEGPPAAVFTQGGGDGSGREDCPEREDRGGGDADASANL
jgi:hypothetical protein